MVSEHGLTVKDYEELKTVEISLKTSVDMSGVLNGTTAAPQIKTEPTAQIKDTSEHNQQCSVPMDNINEETEESAVKSDAVEGTNSESTVDQENQVSKPTVSTMDKPSSAGHVEGEEKPKEQQPRLSLANQCRFKCNRCEESFGSWRELRAHMGKVHNQRYVKCNFNEYAVIKVYYNCIECKAKVLQDYDAIRLHMLTHGINNLEDYIKVGDEKEVESTEVSQKNMGSETIPEESDSEDRSARGKTLSGPESPELAEEMRDESRIELSNSTENEICKKTSTSARILSIRLRDVIKG